MDSHRSAPSMRRVKPRLVHVIFPATGADRPLRLLRVGLRDTSRADAPSPVLAETKVGPLVVPGDGTTVDVVLEPSDAAAQAIDALGPGEATVFAHAAATERDGIDEGDFLSTVSVPLSPGGDIDVPVTYLPVSSAPG